MRLWGKALWQRLSLRTKGLAILALVLLPLVASMVMLLFQARNDRTADDLITSARLRRDAAEDLLAIAIDAETGIRGFVATGNPEFLAPYEAALADLEGLEALVEEARVPPATLDLLEQQYRVFEQLRTQRDSLSPAQRESMLLDGKANMDGLRTQLGELIARESQQLSTELEHREDIHHRTPFVLWFGGLSALLGGVLGMTLFVRSIAGRVKLLQGNSRRIDGDAPLRFVPGRDEIGELGRVLEQTRQALVEKDTLRRDAESEMVLSRDEADRANQAKSEFLSRMSHELRTPLNAILGFAQLLEMDHLEPDSKESVRHIVSGGRHLLDLINEVLDIARIESGHLSLSLEPVGLSSLLEESMSLMRPLAEQGNIDLRCTLPKDLGGGHVTADRQRLKQIVLNLISNGIKYNRAGGSVTLTARDLGDQVSLEVIDTGLGLSSSDLDVLFTPFDRLGAEQTEVEGAGLGLALSKRLAEAMNGEIRVESELGKGSTFVVTLHKADNPLGRALTEELATAAAAPSGTATLLYIEDNISNLKLVQKILDRRPDVELISAMQGRLGIDLAREHAPDLILLDLNLPDLPGGEVLQILKSDPRTSAIPVVMLSADATSGHKDRFRAAGVIDYLTKPIDVAEFLRVIDRVIVEGVP